MKFRSRKEQLEDLFEGFNGGWETLEAALKNHFAPDCTWANAGERTTVGPADALALQRGFGEGVGLERVKIIVHRSVEAGDVLLNERTDYIYDKDGKVLFEIDIAGVFHFEGDKIVSWREYFEPGAVSTSLIEYATPGQDATSSY
jgi:limonene-1,2-epoxide hydrolase